MSVHKHSWKIDNNPNKLPRVGIVRYGAFGDTVQAASVCRQLKKQGYHVTLFCSYPASEVIALDPHIDEKIVQMVNQVPPAWLGPYWVWMRNHWRGKAFDKWINLCESVEANLLAMEGNIRFEWSPKPRHEMMNVNYVEWCHKLAGVPHDPWFEFYPQDSELKWADQELARMRKAGITKFILWSLAGSSRSHKVYPHQASIWRHVLKHYPEWGIVTVGDGSCAPFEKAFESEPKVWRTSGKWNIRQVLTMMLRANVVVGPETGVMSAAAFYSMPKVVFLSHSTVENLTRDWKNTTSLWAPTTVCPGRGMNEAPACHMIHQKFEPGCRRNEQFGVAQCVFEIKPEWTWEVLQRCMNEGIAPLWTPPLDVISSGIEQPITFKPVPPQAPSVEDVPT